MSSSEETLPQIPEEPGNRAPAPGSLRLVQQFVNTNDREGARDQLESRQGLGRWLKHWTRWPPSAAPSPQEHACALVVREGVRGLAQHPPVVDATFESALQELDIRLVVQRTQLRLHSTTRLGGALCPILDAIRTAMDDGTWARLKVCDRDRCRWLFYDSSRNASSRWCATEICGSREKARRAYQRKKLAD